jgi:hypothetical protein
MKLLFLRISKTRGKLSFMSELTTASCYDCIAFKILEGDEDVPQGRCRLRPELSSIPADMKVCDLFKLRGSSSGQVKEPVVSKTRRPGSRRRASVPRPPKNQTTLENPTIGDVLGEISMDRDGLKQVLRELLEEETLYGYPHIGERWQGGKLELKPANPENQSKDMPLETFFHKIVMIRDRLRVLEAKLNAQDNLSDQDKVELQSYISKCYGSLTSFNILFADKSDHFKSK